MEIQLIFSASRQSSRIVLPSGRQAPETEAAPTMPLCELAPGDMFRFVADPQSAQQGEPSRVFLLTKQTRDVPQEDGTVVHAHGVVCLASGGLFLLPGIVPVVQVVPAAEEGAVTLVDAHVRIAVLGGVGAPSAVTAPNGPVRP